MKSALCDRFGIDFPLFAFSHCRNVVAEVSKAGGFDAPAPSNHTTNVALTFALVHSMGPLSIRTADYYIEEECCMHILLGLLSAIGIVVLILWRINQAAEVARGAGEAAKEAHGLFRRLAWRRKADKDPIDLIEDPREAAAAMLVATAQYAGALTEAESETICNGMMQRFGATREQSQALIAQARWLTKDSANLGSVFFKLAPVIEQRCGADECAELIEMLRQVAAHEAERSDIPTQEIDRLEHRLLSAT